MRLRFHKVSAMGRQLAHKALGLCLVLSSAAVLAGQPARASETLSFSYGPLIRSLKVSSLQKFAEDGTVEEDLAFFLALVKPEDYPRLRKALTEKADVDPLVVSRFFNSDIGEDTLERLGKAITMLRGGNGMSILRAALVNAAFSDDGLSLLSVLEQLPANVQIHGEKVLATEQATKRVIAATERLDSVMSQLTAEEAKGDAPADFSAMADLRKPGTLAVTKEVWNLTDSRRNRSFYVDVYSPRNPPEGKLPVIVFSHGLASRPEDFSEAMRQLASHGYVVAAPQHPGSDAIWLKEMLKGLHKDIFDINDFSNRPKDISFVIDELERRNAGQFSGKLDLTRVALVGHSFGGYTVLALGGATVDLAYLKKECERPFGGLNVSLLLQCQALRLPPEQLTNLQDSRTAAVFAANPVNRSIFGRKGISTIKVPVVMASGSYDPATPPALEQAASFTWLTAPDKYWLIVQGQAHVNFTQIDPGIKDAIESMTDITLPSQGVISNYMKGVALPFFEVYLRQNNSYKPYLRSSYAEYLSKDERFKLFMISGRSTPKLVDAIDAFRRDYPDPK
ncbi:alpha/beta hydrolase [Cyanobium sp. ATX 6A2]|uniref:alpha/beta hydrolase n=1 Tax=Cyanobium sp. ATX 6A2 TaxID=2823700 RepID=UPI0020CF0AC1|nr:alpha/beta hydrolase [Cyanobium sp. ATX 6A2]MCP9888148.1 alpha/beta hydrolase [Cyanobium sp. ATX 6A2]